MPIFLNRAQQVYAPNTYNVQGTIPNGADVNSIKITATRVAWPEGPVGVITLVHPGGVASGFTFSGGTYTNPKTGQVATESTAHFYPATGTKFPSGVYTLVFQVLQTITSAVKVEYF